MSYATAWKEWFPLIERAGAPLSRRMIALASLEERDFVLDIGTGIGEPAIMAARSLPNGRVLAIDPDAGMIEIARTRAKSEKVGNVTFLVRTVEELNLPPESVDAVLCRWSLMFVDDPDAALAKLFRLLRPAGRLVAGTWGPPDRVPALSLARAVVHRFFGMDPPRYGPKTAFALSDSDVLAARFRAAGFQEVAQERVPLDYEFPSQTAYIQFRIDCTGPLFATVGEPSAAAQEGALEAIAAALEPFRAVDGSVLLTNDAVCTVGKA